ncbi:MAG: TolB-like 6-bladed beta-propeller domain-containing protein [Prevotellaceae bacterium]|jgi:hypothetical protein|nr:TolB-like 6-bladed beta-propeller domain-containing protein [Prevotellaceae bacterium]
MNNTRASISAGLMLSIFNFFSCSENTQVVKLPEITELSSTSKQLNVEVLLSGRIFIHEDKLIVFEQLHENMFKVFELPTLKYLYSFGDQGMGPNNFVSVGNDDIIAYHSEFVEIYDTGKIKYVKFTDSTAYIADTKPLNLFHLKTPVNRFKKINDSIYYFDNWFEIEQQNEFTRLNIFSHEQSYFSPYPDWIHLASDEEKYPIYLKSTYYNSFNDKIAAFYYHFPVMKLLDSDGNTIKEVRFDAGKVSDYESVQNEVFHFTDAYATDDYIYAQWIGKSKKEVAGDMENFTPEIFVFDWDGNILNRYKLDKPSITFTVSENNRKMYCTSFTETDVIYEYDLPQPDKDTTAFVRLQNSFYSVNILEGYTFAQVSLEDGINKITERHGCKANINYFAQGEHRKHDLEAIQISVYTPIDTTVKVFDIVSGRWKNVNTKQRKLNVNGTDVVLASFHDDSLNPKGEKEILYNYEYIFEKNHRFIKISVASTKNNLTQYHAAMKEMIDSFELKNDGI